MWFSVTHDALTWMHVLGIIHAVQLAVYIALNVWTWRSYVKIPERLAESSDNALLRMGDTSLFIGFIKWCGLHHITHAPIMIIVHGVMFSHLFMDPKAMIAAVVGWFILIGVDYKTARVSHKARKELKLD